MKKSQLDNLIRFCFNFHQTMDLVWTSQTPDYIWEKWQKYIGFAPNKLELYPKDKNTVAWLKNWKVSNENWEKLKEVINFIEVVNSKALVVSGGNDSGRFKQWSPSELISEFENLIGDKNKINDLEYKGLHPVLEKEVEYWLWQTSNKRDYNLNLLV